MPTTPLISRLAGLLALTIPLAATSAQSPQPAIWLKVQKVLTMDGRPLDQGEVLIVDGKITAVGRDLEVPESAIRIEKPEAFMMPGLVELHCHVGVSGGDINDTVIPHNMDMRTLDLILQDSDELETALRSGVTTALVIPGSGSTIGGLGTIIKTAGKTFEQRVIRFPGALKIALHARGGNPARRAGDLGSGRLGLHYMLKVVMRDAQDYHVAWSAFEAGHGEKPKFNPRLDPMRGLFRREFPVILHAYGQNDTMTAVRILHWGLKIPIVISHGVYDSFKIAPELAATGIPMNIGPRQYEFYEGQFIGNAGALHDAGVPVSICTDAPVVAQDQLFLQASMAVRLGFPDYAALRGLTIEPARAVGIDHRVGSITVGKDADLILYDGDPLDPRNAPSLVMVDGKIVHRR